MERADGLSETWPLGSSVHPTVLNPRAFRDSFRIGHYRSPHWATSLVLAPIRLLLMSFFPQQNLNQTRESILVQPRFLKHGKDFDSIYFDAFFGSSG